MRGRVSHGNREAPERRSGMRNHKQTVQGKANRRNPCVGATGESEGTKGAKGTFSSMEIFRLGGMGF